jgi:tetratricopeptide (TPR) repeat protein
MTNPKLARTKIFVSYSHKDVAHLNKLHIHLARFKQQGLIWDDTEIRPGAKWHEQIKQALAATKIAILLVSADFLASNFIANEELPNLLKAAESEGTIILSLILSPCVYEDVLGDFQTVNPNATPLLAMDENQQEQTWVKLHVTVKQYLATQAKPTKTAEQLIAEGEALANEGRNDEALAAYEQAIQVAPHSARAYYYKGLMLGYLERYEDAVEAFDAVLNLAPDAVSYYSKGVALGHLGRYDEALEVIDKALNLDTSDADFYYLKGMALNNLERYGEALEAYDEALNLNSNDANFYYEKGCVLYNLKRYNEALEAYDEVLNLSPNGSANVYNDKADTLERLGKAAEAQQARKKARELSR